MTDENAFLQTILASPDDDLPRLVFADWLEERGDPRGEFIRVQIELTHLGEGDLRRLELKGRKRQLQREHGQRWVAPLRALGVRSEPFVVHFRRGLVEELHMTAALFLENAEAVLHAAPLIRHVKLADASGVLAELALCRHLARLATLDLSENTLNDAGADALADSPYLDQPLLLRLHNCELSTYAQAVLRARFAGRIVLRNWYRPGGRQWFASQRQYEDEEAIPERCSSYEPEQSSILRLVSGERLR